MKKYIYLVFLIFVSFSSYGQTKKEIANTKLDAAIELMDNGMTDDAIILLKEAKNMDSKTHVYDYEIAYAYYLNQEYNAALTWFKKSLKYKDVNLQCYQMLGNTYDMLSMTEKALKIYDKGLKKFPRSGVLYAEKGVVYVNQKKYDEALSFFEKGIFVEPSYPVNYHHATTLYLQSDNEIWGMIYGEIFMNLERNSRRTESISKWLFDTYVSEIKFTSDTSNTVSFAGNHTILIDPKDLGNPKKLQASLEKTLLKMPYRNMVYETTLSLSLVDQDTINLASLNKIRTNFINTYYENKHNEKYPVALFEFSKKLIDLGYYEAYNYWILMKGNEDEFEAWQATHQKQWGEFITWFTDNPLIINESNKFYSDKY